MASDFEIAKERKSSFNLSQSAKNPFGQNLSINIFQTGIFITKIYKCSLSPTRRIISKTI